MESCWPKILRHFLEQIYTAKIPPWDLIYENSWVNKQMKVGKTCRFWIPWFAEVPAERLFMQAYAGLCNNSLTVWDLNLIPRTQVKSWRILTIWTVGDPVRKSNGHLRRQWLRLISCLYTQMHMHTQHKLSIPYHCASNQNEFRFTLFVNFQIFVHLMRLLEDDAKIEHATDCSFIHTSHPLQTIIFCDIFRARDMSPSVKVSTWYSKFFGFWDTWDWGPSR